MLYHLLAGQPPFPDTNIISQMIRHATETPRPLKDFNPAVPDGLQQIVNWMMAKDPAQRYPDAGARAPGPAGVPGRRRRRGAGGPGSRPEDAAVPELAGGQRQEPFAKAVPAARCREPPVREAPLAPTVVPAAVRRQAALRGQHPGGPTTVPAASTTARPTSSPPTGAGQEKGPGRQAGEGEGEALQ